MVGWLKLYAGFKTWVETRNLTVAEIVRGAHNFRNRVNSTIPGILPRGVFLPSVDDSICCPHVFFRTETLLEVQSQHSPLKDCTAPLQYRYGHLCGYATGYDLNFVII